MLWFSLLCLLPPFCIAAVTTALMRKFAPRWGLIDQPAARKVHATPTPLGGGVGIVVGFVTTMLAVTIAVWHFKDAPSLPAWIPTEVAPYLGGAWAQLDQMWTIIGA